MSNRRRVSIGDDDFMAFTDGTVYRMRRHDNGMLQYLRATDDEKRAVAIKLHMDNQRLEGLTRPAA